MAIEDLEPQEVEDGGPCDVVPEIFVVHARRLIGRVTREYLDTVKLLPIELMSDANHITAFDRHGQRVQRAIQLIAGAQARVFRVDLHKRMRFLFNLYEKGREQVAQLQDNINKNLQNLTVEPGSVIQTANILSGIVRRDELDLAVCIMMAQYLRSAAGACEKLDRLLDLVDAEPDLRVLQLVDGIIAELMDSTLARQDIFGPAPSMGVRLLQMAALYKGQWHENLQEDSGSQNVTGMRLNLLMQKQSMPSTRISLEQYIRRNLQGGLPIKKVAGKDELRALVEVGGALRKNISHGEGESYIGGAAVKEALKERMNRQAEPANLVNFIEGSDPLTERINGAIDLQRHAIGDTAKRQIAETIRVIIERQDFTAKLDEEAKTVPQKLFALRRIHDLLIDKSQMPDTLQEKLFLKIEMMQMDIIKKNNFISRIINEAKTPMEGLLKIADAYKAGLFTRGRNSQHIQNLICNRLRHPDFRKALSAAGKNPQETQQKRTAFFQRLTQAGISINKPQTAHNKSNDPTKMTVNQSS